MNTNYPPFPPLPAMQSERLNAQIHRAFAADDAQQKVHEAIEELRQYREGSLHPDRLNYLHGQCVLADQGAPRHQAMLELLIQSVLDAHAQWAELEA